MSRLLYVLVYINNIVYYNTTDSISFTESTIIDTASILF